MHRASPPVPAQRRAVIGLSGVLPGSGRRGKRFERQRPPREAAAEPSLLSVEKPKGRLQFLLAGAEKNCQVPVALRMALGDYEEILKCYESHERTGTGGFADYFDVLRWLDSWVCGHLRDVLSPLVSPAGQQYLAILEQPRGVYLWVCLCCQLLCFQCLWPSCGAATTGGATLHPSRRPERAWGRNCRSAQQQKAPLGLPWGPARPGRGPGALGGDRLAQLMLLRGPEKPWGCLEGSRALPVPQTSPAAASGYGIGHVHQLSPGCSAS
ncbi:uncharacterized protein LOC134509782 isoform X1 [Chroicocephalus ridibundus]|uniref:uncharacterized protein LOC134509775 isoform X1 n=1 Tax=Chroicocephalus ridibundus TaxID=1192867 RepID=UPI002FDEAB27